MTEDNWVYRSKNMRCGACMYFVDKKTSTIQYADNIIGRCRRHAPTMAGWPVVFSRDWCGDHKLDECKLDRNKNTCDEIRPERIRPLAL